MEDKSVTSTSIGKCGFSSIGPKRAGPVHYHCFLAMHFCFQREVKNLKNSKISGRSRQQKQNDSISLEPFHPTLQRETEIFSNPHRHRFAFQLERKMLTFCVFSEIHFANAQTKAFSTNLITSVPLCS